MACPGVAAVDWSCIDQDDHANKEAMVKALPLFLRCCNHFVGLEWRDYWQRGWCRLEVLPHPTPLDSTAQTNLSSSAQCMVSAKTKSTHKPRDHFGSIGRSWAPPRQRAELRSQKPGR
eukprot:COSAG05_NODE_895_length_6700_cov_14.354189_11_plen_118_part_00